MTKFLVLGTGEAERYPIGNKAALLDAAKGAGLPVPEGVIWLDGAAWQMGVLPPFARPLAVRSAFAAEDGEAESLAGFFESVLWVEPSEVGAAIGRVRASAEKRAGTFRRDVLVMEMVNAMYAGVAFTQSDFADDLVNFARGTADGLVSGAEAGEAITLPQGGKPRGRWPFAKRLQMLLRGVRRVFGRKDWDVEWADDGRVCWLVQIRPITRAPRRNEAFTFANIREIMPDPPSYFMASVVQASADGLYEYYRGFDASLPRKRPMIESFVGRPLFNLSLLTETMRHWGLPTALVTNSIGGEADVEMGLNVPRFFRKTFVLLRQGWAQATAVQHAERATAEILRRAKLPHQNVRECAETLRWLFTYLVTEMFNLTAALSGPLLILRLTGTLAEHNARHQAISTAMYSDLEPLRRWVAAHPQVKPLLAAGQLPPNADFLALWQAYLAKHGHRGVYESDIARPRYWEAPEALLSSLTLPSHTPSSPKPRRTVRGWLTLPVWWQCRRVLAAREWWRYNAMLCFDAIRRDMVRLAAEKVAHGGLPSVAHVWQLSYEEWGRLEAGWIPDEAFWQARAEEIAENKKYDLPDLLHRFDDLEAYREGAQQEVGETRLRGVSLTNGRVQGRAWVLSEPATRLPDGFKPETTILVARSVDAGWIPTFARVAGVVVEIGGDLSHGSIILREIGLPAVTNVRGATKAIANGTGVLLEAGRGLISIN